MMTHINALSRQRMTVIVFDTLAYAEKLESVGFTPQQAKGQAHALREIVDNQIATKQDIAALEQDIAALDASVAARLAEAKAELIKWYVGTMLGMTGLIVGLLKFVR
jgi:hypothetical protein